MMKYTHQQLLRIIENHNDPREWETHFLLKRIHPGNDEICISAVAANNRKHNDPREWETHQLLKRTHPWKYENILYQQLLRIIENITIQENEILTSCSKEPIRGFMKYTLQQLLRIIENITIQENGRLTYCSRE